MVTLEESPFQLKNLTATEEAVAKEGTNKATSPKLRTGLNRARQSCSQDLCRCLHEHRHSMLFPQTRGVSMTF